MDEYDKIFKSICRICLSQSSAEKMVSLFDNSTEDGLSSFGKAVIVVTKILLQNNDTLPFMMCSKCIDLLKHAIYFKLMCESNDQKLKQLINSDANIEVSDQNNMEKICDYVMFTHHFPSNASTKYNRKHNKSIKRLNVTNATCETIQNSEENLEVGDNAADKMLEEDAFFNNDDYSDNTNKLSDSDEFDSILVTIQDIINSDMYIKASNGRKVTRQKRKYNQSKSERVRNVMCKICNKMLSNSITYNHHMQRHNHCRFICEQCGKGFPVLSEMHMHQIAKHGIGPYLKCDHCPYKAPRKFNLIEHLRIHTGERPFACEKCGLTFRRKAIWKNHLVHHMEKKHQCIYCAKKFFTRSQMLAHYNNVHERIYRYTCNICSITYTKTETVRRHMSVKHGIPKEKQGKIVRVTNAGSEFPDKFY